MSRPAKQPEPAADPGAKPPGPDAAGIVQVKTRLLGISSLVWRRVLVQVPGTCTLRELHGVIQVAMGWAGSVSETELATALAAGRVDVETEIRALSVRYVADRDAIEIVTTC